MPSVYYGWDLAFFAAVASKPQTPNPEPGGMKGDTSPYRFQVGEAAGRRGPEIAQGGFALTSPCLYG